MQKTLSLSLTMLCLLFATAHAQVEPGIQWKITVKPTEFMLVNFPVTVEKILNDRQTIGLTLGYRPSLQSGGKVSPLGYGLIETYTWNYAFNWLAQGAYVGVNSKFYPFADRTRGKKLYLDAELFYRKWWYNDKAIEYGEERSFSYNSRTDRTNVVGLKVLWGYSIVFNKQSRVKPLMDIYAGASLRRKSWTFEDHGTSGDPAYYNKETGSEWLPSPQIGLQLGLGF